jgi:hypothetical protein
MKTKAVAASAILAIFIISAVAVATAHTGNFLPTLNRNAFSLGSNGDDDNNQTTTQQTSTHQEDDNQTITLQMNTQEDGDNGSSDDGGDNNQVNTNLAVGETFTFSNAVGTFSTSGNDGVSGPATGSLTVKVTGIFDTGITLSIESGHFSFLNSTFTITGGSVILDHDSESGVGSGTAGSATFIIHIDHLPTSTIGSGELTLDTKTSMGEFFINLGTQTSGGDSSGGDSSGDSSGD